jgi:hypothetical protein
VRNVHENESSYIPIGSIHRLTNPGKIPLELIEVQVGSYLGEDDIVRLDDVYGRGSGSRNVDHENQQKGRPTAGLGRSAPSPRKHTLI